MRILIAILLGLLAPSWALAAGWPQTDAETSATPTFYDLDGDGRKDVIFPHVGGTLVFDLDGNRLPGWPPAGEPIPSSSPAAVADIDRDGSPDVVIASPGFPGHLHVLDATGHEKAGWPVSIPASIGAVLTTPVVADLNRDGSPDIVVLSERGVYAFRKTGRALSGWPFRWGLRPNPVRTSIAVGDLDGDGSPEVVAVKTAGASRVYVLTADGNVAEGWPKVVGNVKSSPVLADLDGDGQLEIVLQEGFIGETGDKIWAFRSNGDTLPGFPQAYLSGHYGTSSSPAVADVDGDGRLEIVLADGSGSLYVIEPDGTFFPGFPMSYGGSETLSSPSVLDVDGDGRMEIFLSYNSAAHSAVVGGWRLDGSVLSGFPFTLVSFTDLVVVPSIHVSDADGDGEFELAAAASGTGGLGFFWVLPIPSSTATPAAEVAGWPRIRHDASNSGSR
jgi:hypothetical protein